MRPLRALPLMLSALVSLLAGVNRAEPAAAGAPVLGRLFLTPEWRTALERQRQLNVSQTCRLEGDDIRLDGVVIRSSGKSTVWINGQPQTEGSRDTGVTAALSRYAPGQAILSTGAAATVDLKVGVTLDQATGEKHGGLSDGEIRVHRRTTPRP